MNYAVKCEQCHHANPPPRELVAERDAALTYNQSIREVLHEERSELFALKAERDRLRAAIERALGQEQVYGWYPPQALLDHFRDALAADGEKP